jgi:hypothetical protein
MSGRDVNPASKEAESAWWNLILFHTDDSLMFLVAALRSGPVLAAATV